MMVRKSFCSSLLMTLIWSTGSRVSAHSPNFSHSQNKQLIFDLNDDLGRTESIFRNLVTDHTEQSPLVSLVVGANYSVVTVLIQTVFTPRIPNCNVLRYFAWIEQNSIVLPKDASQWTGHDSTGIITEYDKLFIVWTWDELIYLIS